MILVNIAIGLNCCVFLIFLISVYIFKKRDKNIENKIYKKIIALNFITIVFFLLFQFFGLKIIEYEIYCTTFARLYCCSILSYYFFIAEYLFVATREKDTLLLNKILNNRKKITFISTSFLLCISIIIFLTEFHVKNEGGLLISGFYDYIYYTYLSFYIIFCLYCIIKNKGKYDKNKVIPFYILGVLAVIYIIIGIVFRELTLMCVLQTIFTYLMYLTIENPDAKLVSKLEFAQIQAEKSNRAKSDFLSSMSHELKTPLNAIVGLTQYIKSTNNQEELNEDINDILISSEKLNDLIDEILEINKIDLDKVEIENNNYNPYIVFNNLVEKAKRRIKDKNINLEYSISNNMPTELIGDKNKVSIVISNLLNNAIKYTNQGKVKFDAKFINIDDKYNVIINIKDTGRGMKEEDISNLFTRFNRKEEDMDSNIEGAGLGLAITKSLLDLMNGEIKVESSYGEGTLFTVTIPQKVANNK